MGDEFKKTPQKPLTGLLDLRSEPDNMAAGSFRFRQSFSSPDDGAICRRYGFEKLFSGSNYGNQDFHDQLLPLEGYYSGTNTTVTDFPNAACGSTFHNRFGVREYPTFSMAVETTAGSRRFLVGTQSRIAVLNETTKNYRLIADGFGGTLDLTLQRRWYAGQVKNTLVFTNNHDTPVSWRIDDYPSGCAMQSVKPIPDLALIALTKAVCITATKGHVFMGNLEMNGTKFPNRVIWSDKNDATSYDPARVNATDGSASISGYDSLDDGEVIITMAVLNETPFIFTQTGIWLASPTGNADKAWAFSRVYRGPRGLVYPNTLVTDGLSFYYMGIDGVYQYNTYGPEPVRPDWIHYADGLIYKGSGTYQKFNKNACASHVAGFDVQTKELWISWAEGTSFIPSKSIIFNLNDGREHVDTEDHGYTTFCNFQSDPRPSFRDFTLSYCACSPAELQALGFKFYKEAIPTGQCPLAGGFIPQSIYTSTTATAHGITSEDFSKSSADPDSLCAALGNLTIDDLCRQCNNVAGVFIAASTQDLCLKQIGTALYREICTNAANGIGTFDGALYSSFAGIYEQTGYYSIMRSGPEAYGVASDDKIIKRVKVECSPVLQTIPCAIGLRIGRSYSALDPNDEDCAVLWKGPFSKHFVCPLTKTAAEYAASNTRPANGIEWALFNNANYLYWELTIANLTDPNDIRSSLVPAIGGAGCFASITKWIKVVKSGAEK